MRKINIHNNRENPFTVPEGYFDDLPARVMATLPQVPQPDEEGETTIVVDMPRRHRAGWWAAGAVAACLACAVMLTHHNTPQDARHATQLSNAATTGTYDEESYAALLEYAMVDNQAIYTYLSGSY